MDQIKYSLYSWPVIKTPKRVSFSGTIWPKWNSPEFRSNISRDLSSPDGEPMFWRIYRFLLTLCGYSVSMYSRYLSFDRHWFLNFTSFWVLLFKASLKTSLKYRKNFTAWVGGCCEWNTVFLWVFSRVTLFGLLILWKSLLFLLIFSGFISFIQSYCSKNLPSHSIWF